MMSFKGFTEDLEISGVVKSVNDVKELFRAYNLRIEDEEDDDFPPCLEPIIEMTYDDSNDLNSDHEIAKRQLDELEAQSNIDLAKDLKRSKQLGDHSYDRNSKFCHSVQYDQYYEDNYRSANTSVDGSEDGQEEPGEGPILYKCDICSAGFRIKHSITKHKRVVHGMHQFSCMFCKESYPLKRILLEHILTHRGPHGFKCNVCNKVRPNYLSIQRHVKTHGEKCIPCTKCSARFKTKWELRSHEIQHQEDRNFKCKACELSFANPTSLRKHLKRHKGTRPYSCDICGKDFSAQGNLTNHKRQHANIKPVKCQYCSLTFNTLEARKKHVIVHDRDRKKPYECEVCQKKYTSTTSLAVHRLKFHSGGEVFDCNYCNRQFPSKKEISEHMLEHSQSFAGGKVPYEEYNAYSGDYAEWPMPDIDLSGEAAEADPLALT